MANDIASPAYMGSAKGFFSGYRGAVMTGLVICAYLAAKHFYFGAGWIGPDNDDAMRLVEVRDLLAGQGWFDHIQYRLGLAGGASMHWSRLVDAPIAALIMFFSLFVPAHQAEAAAVFIWPLLTIFPLVIAISTACKRLGGEQALLPGYVLSAFAIIGMFRFGPGSIDHHNVQLALAAIMVAGLLDRQLTSRSFAIAGIAAAVAMAVGVETLPLVAICCACVALIWAHHGLEARSATLGFCGGFAAALIVLFFINIGPSEYTRIYCDAFSAGFFAIGLFGSVCLWFGAKFVSGKGLAPRIGVLLAIGAASFVVAELIAPQCLEKPYAGLDPLLRELWLDHVMEAQSIVGMAREDPFKVVAFYAVPTVALLSCAWSLWKGERSLQVLTISFLIFTSFAIALYQVRGAPFAMMLSVIPLSDLVARKRAAIYRPGSTWRDHLVYVVTTFASVSMTWALASFAIQTLIEPDTEAGPKFSACTGQAELAALAAQPQGLVASVSNLGSWILLYTGQRALSAPYHRNQAGMLASLKISTLPPAQAVEEARNAGVTLIAVCPTNSETKFLIHERPDGLLADLVKGVVPDLLVPVPGTQDAAVQLYTIKPAGRTGSRRHGLDAG